MVSSLRGNTFELTGYCKLSLFSAFKGLEIKSYGLFTPHTSLEELYSLINAAHNSKLQ